MLLLSGCALSGKLIADNQKERCECQKGIIAFLSSAENKLKSTRMPMPQLISEMSEFCGTPLFIKECDRLIKGGALLHFAWERAVDSDIALKKTKSAFLLKSLGNQLGTTDIDGQLSCIGYCRREIEKQLISEEEKSNRYSRVFPTLGVLTGVWAIILFI